MFGVNVQPGGAGKPGQSAGAASGGGGGTSSSLGGPKKPILRGTLMRLLKMHFIGAFTLVATVGITWRIGVVNRRRNKYLQFYQEYNPRADYERMKKVGVFHSVDKEGTVAGNA